MAKLELKDVKVRGLKLSADEVRKRIKAAQDEAKDNQHDLHYWRVGDLLTDADGNFTVMKCSKCHAKLAYRIATDPWGKKVTKKSAIKIEGALLTTCIKAPQPTLFDRLPSKRRETRA